MKQVQKYNFIYSKYPYSSPYIQFIFILGIKVWLDNFTLKKWHLRGVFLMFQNALCLCVVLTKQVYFFLLQSDYEKAS